MTRRQIAGGRALVTGASSGIGREIARELARQGADLILVARRANPLAALAEEIQMLGRRAEIVIGDVTDTAVREVAVRRAQSWGGLEILVNNAGVGALGPFAAASPDRLRRVMEVNFFALAEMTRSALPQLQAGRQPIVVNVGSILGHRALPRSSEYCASKFAVRGLTQSLRLELASLGIDVLLISPATTETEFGENLLERTGPAAMRAATGVSAERVAARSVKAIRRGQRELFPDLRSRMIYHADRLAPWLVEWFIRRGGKN